MSPFAEQFQGKNVVVTGAGKGIGRALVASLHSIGAQVYAVSRTQTDLDDIVKEHPGVKVIRLDISNWNETKNTLTASLPNKLDVLINNAAVLDTYTQLEITEEAIDRLFNTNVKAVINVTQVCVKKMIASGTAGIVVNISSVGGIRPSTHCPVYCATKAALDALTKTMAVEFGKHKIRVVSFNPALIETPMGSTFIPKTEEEKAQMAALSATRCPLGDYLMPMDQVVNCILFLGSGIAGMMTGSGMVLDAGMCAT